MQLRSSYSSVVSRLEIELKKSVYKCLERTAFFFLDARKSVAGFEQPSAEFIGSQRERSAKVIFFHEVMHPKDRIKIQLTSTRTSTVTIHEMTNWNFQFENGQTHL